RARRSVRAARLRVTTPKCLRACPVKHLTPCRAKAKHGLMLKSAFAFAALTSCSLALHGAERVHTFKKVQLTEKFWAEGANIGDFNHDGKPDLVSGPYWYEGPKFQKRHEIFPANATFKLKKSDGTE